MSWSVLEGDCVEAMRAMDEASVDAVVCDPPYGLEFMGREWDSFRVDDTGTARHRGERAGSHGDVKAENPTNPAAGRVAYGGGKRPSTNRCVECGKRDQFRNPHEPCGEGTWRAELIDPHAAPPTMLAFQEWSRQWALEAKRVLKPGGHLLAFGGTRTYHRLACAIEDAGFEIRDCIAWLYGSGFPKSLGVSKAIDAQAGAVREVLAVAGSDGAVRRPRTMNPGGGETEARQTLTAPATPDAERWQGWGTALKPAHEPIVVARKPLAGTVAATVLAHGTGALNVDGCRIAGPPSGLKPYTRGVEQRESQAANHERVTFEDHPAGRWPANVVLDEEAARALDEMTGERGGGFGRRGAEANAGDEQGLFGIRATGEIVGYGDSGGASRFFYTAKASSAERSAGLDNYAQHGKICACRDLKGQAPSPARATSELTEADASDCSTAGHGSSTTDRSPTASKSITETATRPTTGSRTSSSSPPPSTNASTLPTSVERATVGSDGAPSAVNGSPPMPSTTTSAWRDGSSTDGVDRATSRESSPTSSSAVCADCGGVIAGARRNVHPLEPTVKPIDLMRWLVRLVTPSNGTVLDPFTGSGTTGIAASLEGFDFLGIEREAEYAAIARARLAWWAKRGQVSTEAALRAGLGEDVIAASGQSAFDLLGGAA